MRHMHERLSVNTIGCGLVAVTDVLDSFLDRGLTRLGIPIAQLEAGDRAGNIAAVRASGADVVDVVEPAAFTLPDPSAWTAERNRLRACLDLAAEVDAAVLYITTGPAAGLDWSDAAARFRDAVAPVLQQARAAGVTIAVENTTTMRADLGFLHRLAD